MVSDELLRRLINSHLKKKKKKKQKKKKKKKKKKVTYVIHHKYSDCENNNNNAKRNKYGYSQKSLVMQHGSAYIRWPIWTNTIHICPDNPFSHCATKCISREKTWLRHAQIACSNKAAIKRRQKRFVFGCFIRVLRHFQQSFRHITTVSGCLVCFLIETLRPSTSITPQTHDMIFNPVTLHWHKADLF